MRLQPAIHQLAQTYVVMAYTTLTLRTVMMVTTNQVMDALRAATSRVDGLVHSLLNEQVLVPLSAMMASWPVMKYVMMATTVHVKIHA